MNAKPQAARVPVLALSVDEACEALGVSWKTWQEHVASEVRIVRLGRRKLIAVSELQRFMDERGERILDAIQPPARRSAN